MTPEEDRERGRQAQAVLENPVYAEAHAAIEQEVIKQWRDARNPQDREQLHQLLLMPHLLLLRLQLLLPHLLLPALWTLLATLPKKQLTQLKTL